MPNTEYDYNNIYPLRPDPPQDVPIPDPFDDPEPRAEYPIDALGPMLSEAARALHAITGADTALICNTLLGWLSFATQAHANVRIVTGSVSPNARPISLFTLSIAESGSRKTTVDSLISNAFKSAMHKLEDDYASQIETYIAAKAAFKEREKEIAKEIKEARAAENHRAVDKLQAELLSAKPTKPLSPKRVYDDTTLEAFIHPMMERHPSLGLMTDEGAKLLGGYSLRKDGKGQAAAYMVGMWDGNISRPDSVADQRMSRQRTDDPIPHPPIRGRRVTINIAAQAIIVEPFIKDPILRGQGLISRFLSVRADQPPINRRSGLDLTHEHAQVEALAAHICKIATAEPRMHPDNKGVHPYTINPAFGSDARQFLQEKIWDAHLSREPGNKYPRTHAMASRAMEHLCRIAAVLCVSDYFQSSAWPPKSDHPFTITRDMAIRAAKLTKWYLDESLRIDAVSQEASDDQRARELWDWVQSKGGEAEPFQFSLAELQRSLRIFKNDREGAIKAIRLIEARDLIEAISPDGKTTPLNLPYQNVKIGRLRFRTTQETQL